MSKYFKVSLTGFIRDWRDAEIVVKADNEAEVNNILGHIHENRGFHLDFTDGPAEYSGVVVCAIEPCKKPDEDTMVVSEGCKVVFIEMNTLQDDRGYDEDDE